MVEHAHSGIWGKSEFYRALEEATGHDGLGGQGFPYKACRSHDLGQGKLAKAELEECGFFDRHFL